MKANIYPLIYLIIILVLNACSPFIIVSSTGQQAAPVESYDLAGTDQSVSGDNVE